MRLWERWDWRGKGELSGPGCLESGSGPGIAAPLVPVGALGAAGLGVGGSTRPFLDRRREKSGKIQMRADEIKVEPK